MKPRILHVIDHTGSGGAQAVVRDLARALQSQWHFAVAVLGNSGHYSDDYRSLGVPVYELGSRHNRWSLKALPDLLKIVRRERFDIVHTHLFKANVLGTVAAKLTERRTILHEHTGVDPHTLPYYIVNKVLQYSYLSTYRQAIRSCDKVVVLTPAMQQQYQINYPVTVGKINVIPNAIDTYLFKEGESGSWNVSLRAELNLPADTKLVAMVGRVEPEKDWWTFLKVAECVCEIFSSPVAFLVVGVGSEDNALRRHVRMRGLDNIFFLGYRNDIPSLLAQTDVFLLTSRSEAFGIAILEAMAAGCPVVATCSDGPASILSHGDDGLLAAVGDVEQLSNHIICLLNDRELAKKYVKQARTTVEERYSLRAVAARMDEIYSGVYC